MRNFTLFILLFFTISKPVYGQKTKDPIQGKNILIVYGGWEGHQPEIFAHKIADWFNSKSANVTLSKDTEIYTQKELMKKIDLVINHITMSEMSYQASEGLREAVASGTGLAGCHGGLGDSFRDDTEYQYMVGGQFVKHPGGQVDYNVHITAEQDSITAGIQDFNLHTEQYFMHYDPSIKVLATTTFTGAHDPWIEGIIMPVIWKKYYGKGRVFYSALGHSEDLFDRSDVWTLMTRGAVWAIR